MESVLSQTLETLEVICVDDSSTDSSLEILKGFEAVDTRVQVFSQKHEGAGAARNKGLSRASGAYLAFLDADDYFEPDMLEKMFVNAQRWGSDIVICRTSTFSNDAPQPMPEKSSVRGLEGKRVYSPRDLQAQAFHYCVGWPWDKLFKRSFILEHKLKFQDLMSSNDAYFVYTALLLAESISFVDEYLVYHRVGSASSIENRRASTWQNAFLAIDAIEQRLRQEALYDLYEDAFLGWIYDFCLWNFETLKGDSKEAFLNVMREKVLPRIKGVGKDRLICDYETDYLDMIEKPHADLLQEHIESYWKIRYLDNEKEMLRKDKEELRATLKECSDSYEQSLSYRIGRAITAVPRRIRNRVQTRRES
jgi:glycosyltransferase involved in cell wall biosynthesis